MNLLEIIKQSAREKIIYSLHALDEMNAEDELITTDEMQTLRHGGKNEMPVM